MLIEAGTVDVGAIEEEADAQAFIKSLESRRHGAIRKGLLLNLRHLFYTYIVRWMWV